MLSCLSMLRQLEARWCMPWVVGWVDDGRHG